MPSSYDDGQVGAMRGGSRSMTRKQELLVGLEARLSPYRVLEYTLGNAGGFLVGALSTNCLVACQLPRATEPFGSLELRSGGSPDP